MLACCCLSFCAWAIISFGAFFKYSRKSSVNGPRPMDVKKLIAYRVLRALSFGNIPLYHSIYSGSSVANRSFSVAIPKASAISCIKILINIRLDEVVSSSFKCMIDKTLQGIESVCSKCANNFATFRNLFVSNRCIVVNCRWNAAMNASHHRLPLNKQNRAAINP